MRLRDIDHELHWFWRMRRYELRKRKERLIRWVVWRLPREIVMWSYIRIAAHATTGKYGDTVVPEIKMMDALKRWDDVDEGDESMATHGQDIQPLTWRQFVLTAVAAIILRAAYRRVAWVVRAFREVPTFKADVDG
jgi:hypothetical protein